MKKFSQVSLLVLSLAALAGWTATGAYADPITPPGDHPALVQELPIPAAAVPMATGTSAEVSVAFSTTDVQVLEGTFGPLPLPAAPPIPQHMQDTCRQLLLNPELDVIELGDGTGRAEPWVIYDQIVYYSSADYVSAEYSLLVLDADEDVTGLTDSTPTQDAFAQAFYMPDNLTSVTIHYYTAAVDANTTDRALGNLWTVDDDGELLNALGSWEVGESSGAWQGQTVPITDPAALALMEGQRMAIVLFNQTDGNTPGEIVYFDDVTLTACTVAPPTTVYLPLVLRSYGVSTGPVCRPPTENPQDTWDGNRGYTDADAICDSTLSRIDLADYYTFVPPVDGNYTLHLRNLPAGTEWAAHMYVDQAAYPPPYAPGPTTGQCRIDIPGAVDKSVTCPLEGGKGYFVKVSAGASYTGPEGGYQMQIVSPSGPSPSPSPTATSGPSGWVTLASEDFEGSFPGVWDVYDNDGTSNGEYYWAKRNCRSYAGSYSGWAVGGGANGGALSCGSNYPNDADSWMAYGPFSLADATDGDLSFKLWLNSESGYDALCRFASIDGSDFYGSCTSGNSQGWIDRVLDLTDVYSLGNLMGRSNVWVALVFLSDFSNTYPEGAYVDDVALRKYVSSTSPGASSAVPVPDSGQIVEFPMHMVRPSGPAPAAP